MRPDEHIEWLPCAPRHPGCFAPPVFFALARIPTVLHPPLHVSAGVIAWAKLREYMLNERVVDFPLIECMMLGAPRRLATLPNLPPPHPYLDCPPYQARAHSIIACDTAAPRHRGMAPSGGMAPAETPYPPRGTHRFARFRPCSRGSRGHRGAAAHREGGANASDLVRAPMLVGDGRRHILPIGVTCAGAMRRPPPPPFPMP